MAELIEFDMDCSGDEMASERNAKIFQAGDYPDKGIIVTEDDLDEIVERFQPRPVKIEHISSPLDPLGYIRKIWKTGKDLYGKLAFPKEIADFLEKRGIRKLSVGLNRDPLTLEEVSIVLNPRIPDAMMFNNEIFNIKGDESMENEKPGYQQMQSEINDLKFAMKCKEIDSRLAELRSAGKLVPASETYAKEILLKGDGKISFSDNILTISELFERFLEAQPPVVIFNETAKTQVSRQMPPLSAEDEEMISRLGITREQLERFI